MERLVLENLETFVSLVLHRAEYQPHKVAYSFLGDGEKQSEQLTYFEIDSLARRNASFLQHMRMEGERALLVYDPGLDFVVAFLSCLYAGVVAVPIHPPQNRNFSRVRAITANAEAKLIMTSPKLLEKIKSYEDGAKCDDHEPKFIVMEEIDPYFQDLWKYPKITKDSLAFIQYTSGSTGVPKGVMISHGNLLSNSSVIHECFEHKSESRGVIWLPPYHDMGLIGGILQPLYGGFTVSLMSPISFLKKPIRWLKAISNVRATTSGGPNFAYDLCVRRINVEQCEGLDLSSWDLAFTGAEPIRMETIDLFAQKFEPYGFQKESFYPCYGMAEATLIVTGGLKSAPPFHNLFQSDSIEKGRAVIATSHHEQKDKSLVSCGFVRPGMQLKIVDPESLLQCSDGVIGEIWISGSSVAKGYWRLVQETEKLFRARMELGDILFHRTGDLGFMKDEELFVTGRIKDMIIVRGKNHYPQDIEETVERMNISAMRTGGASAFSIESDGCEQLVFLQELERGYKDNSSSKMAEDIAKEIAIHHGLEAFSVTLVKAGSLPKTSSNKIQRYLCRKSFQEDSLNIIHSYCKKTTELAT
jgi:acyl-CoA synthetase (AMP-forming)/AMP-acid ligase II